MLLNRDLEQATAAIAKALYDGVRGKKLIMADRFVHVDERIYDCRPLAAAALEAIGKEVRVS